MRLSLVLRTLGLLWLIAAGSSPISAKASLEGLLTVDEFKSLAVELSKKVNLFQAIWTLSPNAEFFGGTSRDYLYWLRGQFQNLRSKDEVAAKIEALRKLDMIDAKTFIIGESDIDVVSDHPSLAQLANEFRFKKIDQIGRGRFMKGGNEAWSEKAQGYIPVEKIRLGLDGFIAWDGFGDGIQEIYNGRPSLHSADPTAFPRTIYALKGRNHQLFLALRYLRILAVNHFYLYGRGYPEDKILFDIDPESERQTRDIITQSLEDPELERLLSYENFRDKTNALMHKMFRSYTSPTAAHRLHEYFGIPALHLKFGNYLDTTNQYLFAKPPMDPSTIESRLREYGFSPSDIFQKPEEAFPGLLIYHGVAAGPAAFRSINLQGFYPSSTAKTKLMAGNGLYVVNEPNKDHAIAHCKDASLVIQVPIDPKTRIIDITEGKGAELFQKFKKSEDAFADYFGAQIVKYPHPFPAFVVKDSAVLGRARGMNHTVITLAEILEKARKLQTHKEALAFIKEFPNWELSNFEQDFLKKKLILPWFVDRRIQLDSLDEIIELLKSPLGTLLTKEQVGAFRSNIVQLLNHFIPEESSIASIQDTFKRLKESCPVALNVHLNFETTEREFLIRSLIREAMQIQPDPLLELLIKWTTQHHEMNEEMRRKVLEALPPTADNPYKTLIAWALKTDSLESPVGENSILLSLVLTAWLRSESAYARNRNLARNALRFIKSIPLDKIASEKMLTLGKQTRPNKVLRTKLLHLLERITPKSKSTLVHEAIHHPISFSIWASLVLGMGGVGTYLLFSQEHFSLFKTFFGVAYLEMSLLLGLKLPGQLSHSRTFEDHSFALRTKIFADGAGIKCSRWVRKLATIEMKKNKRN